MKALMIVKEAMGWTLCNYMAGERVSRIDPQPSRRIIPAAPIPLQGKDERQLSVARTHFFCQHAHVPMHIETTATC